MNLLIYIGDSLVDLYEKTILAITYAFIDIRDLKIRRVSFSSTVNLPPTGNNLTLLGFPNEISSASSLPYEKTYVRCLFRGIEYFKGRLIINQYEKKLIKVNIYNEVIDVFDSIKNKKLHELRHLTNSAWNATNIDTARLATSNVVAPVLNWGQFNTVTPSINPTLYLPSYFYMELIQAILDSTGFEFEGDILTDADLAELIIPFSAEEFKYVQAYSDERSFEATNSTPQTETSPAGAPGSFKITVIDTITRQGSEEWFETANSRWQIPDFSSTGDIGNAELFVSYDISVEVGTSAPNMYVELQIRKNGGTQILQSVQHDISSGASFNFVSSFAYGIQGTTAITFADNDYFEVWVGFSDDGVGTIDSITVNSVIFHGNPNRTPNRNFLFHNYLLPDIDQVEVLRDFFVRTGSFLTLQQDGVTVRVTTLKQLLSNKGEARDWTNKRSTSIPDLISFNYESYAQSNYFNYSEGDDVPETLGRGILSVENENIEETADYFDSEFENCLTQNPGSGFQINMAYIPVYDNTSSVISDFVNAPGLKVLTLRAKTATEVAVTFNATPRNDYRVAYFVDVSQDKDTGFQYFINQYYTEMQEAFTKTKLIERHYNLNVMDVLGDLNIIFDTDAFYLVNKIDKFIPEKITKVELLRIF